MEGYKQNKTLLVVYMVVGSNVKPVGQVSLTVKGQAKQLEDG